MDIFEKYKHLQDYLDIERLSNKNIIYCQQTDIAIHWTHHLTYDKKLISISRQHIIYYSEKFDVYFFYSVFENYEEIIIDFKKLSQQKNFIHFLVCDFRGGDETLKYLEENHIDNLNFSIVNHMGEVVYDTTPKNLKSLTKLKYYFSCSDVLKNNGSVSEIADIQKSDKFILDYKYSLTYFYSKLGLNNIKQGDHVINNNNRLNKVFLYSKVKTNSQREVLVNMALDTGRTQTKEFNTEDWFWNYANYNSNHISFIVDYNICKFNLVMETQPLTKEPNKLSKFVTEKILKSFLVPTPSYVVLQEDVYRDLEEYGFYFLNKEFGFYDYSNYEKFCDFLKNADDFEINELFVKTYNSSMQNKQKLENYIYSDKIKEIKLLTNKD
jgi:hypothetical protein